MVEVGWEAICAMEFVSWDDSFGAVMQAHLPFFFFWVEECVGAGYLTFGSWCCGEWVAL